MSTLFFNIALHILITDVLERLTLNVLQFCLQLKQIESFEWVFEEEEGSISGTMGIYPTFRSGLRSQHGCSNKARIFIPPASQDSIDLSIVSTTPSINIKCVIPIQHIMLDSSMSTSMPRSALSQG